MKHILKTTDMRRYTYIAAGGTEPLRTYKKTLSLLQTRLQDSYPDFVQMLATPHMQTDGNIEWTTERFDTLPRPLTALAGEEKAHYSKLLHESMSRLKRALDSLPAESDVAELHAIASVPTEDTIYCADNRIVIAEWGLRPSTGSPAFSLLSFADTVPEKYIPEPPKPEKPKETPKPAPAPTETEKPKVTAPPVTPPPPSVPQPPQPEKPKEEPPVITTEAEPFKMVPPIENPADIKGEKKKRTWLWILIALLGALLIFAIVMMLTRCSSAETVATLPKQAPEIKKENVTLDDDSIAYVVNNRLNIMVLDGSLNDFIKEFRKEYPDKERYQLSSPDTVTNRVLLILPPDDTKKLQKELPQKFGKFNLIVAPEMLTTGSYVPSDPAMNNQQESYYFDMINAPEAWDIEKGNPNVIVAVLDDGFDTNHPEIVNKTVKPYDCFRQTAGTVASPDGHGQHTAGTAVGEADNNSGACGVAPGCSVMPVNVFTPQGSPMSLIMDGMVYAANNGAKVISISIGSYFGPMLKFAPPEQQRMIAQTYAPEVAQMFDQLYRKLDEMGVTVVTAAGNETILAEVDPMKRSSYPIVVSAVDPQGNLAIFDPATLNGSNWGDRCDISAPGLAIYNSVPGGYDYMNGTSMACPQVAGGAALLLSHNPNLTPQQIKKILVATAVPVEENIGPLMDLAAALQADPDNLPELAQKNPATQPEMRRGKDPDDPYSFFYSQPNPVQNPGNEIGQNPGNTPGFNPSPNPSVNPGINPYQTPTPHNPADCAEAAEEMQKLLDQYDRLLKRYGSCL